MKKDEATKPEQSLEGEGSYSATRKYNKHLGDAIEGGDLEAGADAARRALEGAEGEDLERAAQQAKQGPKGRAGGGATPQNK